MFPWEGVLRWEGLLCHRGDTVSLYSVADGGGLLLLPIAGRVPRPRGGMVCPPRPAPSPQSHQGPLLRLDGGTWSHVMSLQSLSLPSLKWGLVSWTRGFARDTTGSLCLVGVLGKTAAGIFQSCGSPIPNSSIGGNACLLQLNPLRRVGCPAECCDFRASPVTHRLQSEMIGENTCQRWSQHPCQGLTGKCWFRAGLC